MGDAGEGGERADWGICGTRGLLLLSALSMLNEDMMSSTSSERFKRPPPSKVCKRQRKKDHYYRGNSIYRHVLSC